MQDMVVNVVSYGDSSNNAVCHNAPCGGEGKIYDYSTQSTVRRSVVKYSDGRCVVWLCSSFRPSFRSSSRSDTLTPVPERSALPRRLFLARHFNGNYVPSACLCGPGGRPCWQCARREVARRHGFIHCGPRRVHETPGEGVAANSLSYRGDS